jgi:AcrR family transcriptional regulator
MHSECNEMKRTYTLRRRAEQQQRTRRKILEAALELDRSLGPGQTNVGLVAERAGVQRRTLYAYFPDERSLHLACSGLAFERDPLPNAQAWAAIRSQDERLSVGLRAIYDWYERNADLIAHALRDAEYHTFTREIAAVRYVPWMAIYCNVLGKTLTAKQRAVLRLASRFFTWRALVRESGLKRNAAVAAMVRAITCE